MAETDNFDNFHLDTKNMDAIIVKVQEIAQKMEDTKRTYRNTVTSLTRNWTGSSRNMFDKESAQLLQRLTDISESFYEIGEDLLKASEAYIQADTNAAKAADGVQNRYGGVFN